MALSAAAILTTALGSPASAATVTVTPASAPGASAMPFGGSAASQCEWGPFLGFVYKNVPAFDLASGDVLAFDLGAVNDSDFQAVIAMAPTTTNGGDVPSTAFTTVVTNTQIPANPRGDTTIGDFELQFRAEAPFVFSGGGLVIRFSSPGGGFAADSTCDQAGVATSSVDASGRFVERFFDPDGVFPWSFPDPAGVSGFRVTNVEHLPSPADTTPPTTTIAKTKINQAKHKATFRFLSSEPGSSFLCKLDKRAFASCVSPQTYRHLKTGKHRFRVEARDTAGNLDASPAIVKFMLKPTRPRRIDARRARAR